MGAPKRRSSGRRRSRTVSQVRLGQHFFRSRSVALRIIHSLGLKKNQTVLELGAGEGFFTELIAPDVESVTATEIDLRLISRLNSRFSNAGNVRVVRKSITSTIDFGAYDVVFGNIPFSRTAEIFRKVSRPPVRFSSCHLIVQTEAANRLLGVGRPTEMALLAFPFVEVHLGMKIQRWAYSPQPSVDTTVLHIRTRHEQLIAREYWRSYRAFVKNLLRSGSRKLSAVIGGNYSYSAWNRIRAQAGLRSTDSHLVMDMRMYVDLFNVIQAHSRSAIRDKRL
ncbi:MAG: methyltransferase [Chloroflexi bacterium]|nr:methyltransferase [Chloroflexota bacterium]